MPNTIFIKGIPDKTLEVIYDKQLEYSKEKHRKVNLSDTVLKMLHKAYLVDKSPPNERKEKT